MHAHDRSASSSSSSSTTSSSSSSEDASTQQLQQELCAAALPYVHQLGWSQAALLAGAKDLGLSPAVIGVLPRQQASLVEYLIQQHNQQLVQQLQGMQQELAGMGTTAKVRTAVKARLEMLGPYINTWPQALSILARPRNSVAALQLLATLVDDIWYHAAGDTSTDTSWYTKRALLAAVYSSTELFMLTDFTPHFQDTWEFLDRRLGDVAALGKASRGVTGVTQGLGEALAALATSRNPVIPGPPRPFV
jgi:ubiquinone biosynthesis protein COQ9